VANTITEVLPKILAQGLMALRQNAVMPQLVNRSYSDEAAQKGNVINVPIPSALSVRSITPGVTQATNVDFSPTAALVTLDYWKESVFQFSDSDYVSVMNGTASMQASEAIKALGNDVDAYIAGKHIGLFGVVGTAGTTPFNGSISAAASARNLLNKQLAPMTDRRAVIDPDAENNLLQVSNIIQFDQRGDQGGIISGSIGTKLGLDWYMDQNLASISYTPGTAWLTGWVFDGSNAAGVSTAAVVFTNSGTVKIGDVFSLTAGGLGYVVTAATTAVTSTTMNLSFYPPLRSAVATAASLVIGAGATAYQVNLAFHRDCFAWASRPLGDIAGLGNSMLAASDPVSGIALRLEASRQYRQMTLAYDILGGSNVVRRELGVKIKG
jgi:hypothetical protein